MSGMRMFRRVKNVYESMNGLLRVGVVKKRGYLVAVLPVVLAVTLCLISCGKSGPTVTIDLFQPSGDVLQTTNFTITFSDVVVPDSIVGTSYDKLPVSFEPDIPGSFTWIAPNKLRFFPDVLLLPSTEYRVEVSSQLTNPYGYNIADEHTFTFRTLRFRVVSASLLLDYIPDRSDVVNVLATVEFNYPVEPSEAAKLTKLKYPDGTVLDLSPLGDSATSIVNFRAEKVGRGAQEEALVLTVGKDLLCADCGRGLAGEYTHKLTLPGQTDLKVESVIPVRQTDRRGYVRVEFNLPVSSQTVSRYITVEPKVDYRVNANYRYLDLAGEFDIGTTYQVKLARGMRAIDGSALERDFSTAVTFRKVDIPPQISFVGQGFYLTRDGNLNLGLSTINVDSVMVGVEKVFSNNLSYLLNSADLASPYSYYMIEALGQRIGDTTLDVSRLDNEEVVTPLNVEKILSEQGSGIYHFVARSTETRWRRAQTWVVATDIGIVAKQSKSALWVWANSLSTLGAVAGAKVEVYSRNNQLLLSGSTNNEGIAVFEDFARRTIGFNPFLVTVSSSNDFSFLELDRRRIATTDFAVDGRPIVTDGYDAFVYSERGVYRPGETAHLAAIIRDAALAPPAPFPVILTVTGPDNRILSEQRATPSSDGFVDCEVAIPGYAKTGRYSAVLKIGANEELGRSSFNVEEFVPDRMKVKITTPRLDFFAGQKLNFEVEGMTLFGPPAAGRLVDAVVELEAFPFSPDQWSSFVFGDGRKSFSRQEFKLDRKSLSDNGKHSYSFDIPAGLEPPAAIRGVISATVLEPGGRGVSAYHAVGIHPHEAYVGLRQAKEGYAKPGEESQFEFIVTSPDGAAVANRNVEISFYRVVWQSVLRQVRRGDYYRYVSERVEQLQETFTVTSQDKVARFAVRPSDYGRYLIVATDTRSAATTSLHFYASGWGYSPWAMDNPDRVNIDLDKAEYAVGDKVICQIRAPFTGKLLMTVENGEVLDHRVVDLVENTATIELPVRETYKPNVYVSAHLIRSTKSLERDTPVRAFGVTPLMVNTSDRHLEVRLEAPDVMLPKRDLNVNFQVEGADGKVVPITIAAVDEGILQLTDFQTPDPFGHFLGKRRLEIETGDIYGVILPEIKSFSIGGDVEAARKRHLTPMSITRVKPVVLWSGVLRTDQRGYGSVRFPIPEFSGTIRLMAVTASGNKFGSAERKTIVRRPLQMTPTFPRFLAGGDKFSIPVSVFNGTGSRSRFEIELEVEGPVQLTGSKTQEIELNNNEERSVYFDLIADEGIGKAVFHLRGEGGGEQSEMETEVPLRPPVPVITRSGNGMVGQDNVARFEFPSQWIEGSTDFQVTVSSFPTVRFSGSLQYLLRYPHGCLEQTVSRILPLLYLNDLARMAEPELFERNSTDYYIEEGIAKLEALQTGTGDFDFWPNGGYINPWGTVYAAHFLVEARNEGYQVTDRCYDSFLSALRRYTRGYDAGERWKNQVGVYACYVLALAGQPERSSMNFFKENLAGIGRDYVTYLLAGSFAHSGDMATARQLLPKSAAPVGATSERESGGNFNSSVRAEAIMLDVLAEVDPKNPMVPLLVKDLSRSADRFGRWYNTQENAYALLALGKIMRQQSGGSFTGSLSVGGERQTTFDTHGATVSGKDWAGKEVVIEIEGNGACYYYWRADGLPTGRYIDESDSDLIVRRRLLNEDGHTINLSDIAQGDLLVAEITVKAPTESLKNVAIVDLLPAGLEIENPRLQSRRSIKWIEKKAFSPQFLDYRDDRMIFYTDLQQGVDHTFYYSLRAVTLGDFILPPIRAEAMYAPMKASVASSGKIHVRR